MMNHVGIEICGEGEHLGEIGGLFFRANPIAYQIQDRIKHGISRLHESATKHKIKPFKSDY